MRLNDIPKWLRNSSFYDSLEKDLDEEFYIDEKYLFCNIHEVNSLNDFESFLNTVNFWDVYNFSKNIPDNIVEFIKENSNECLYILYNFINIPLIKELLEDVETIRYDLECNLKLQRQINEQKIYNIRISMKMNKITFWNLNFFFGYETNDNSKLFFKYLVRAIYKEKYFKNVYELQSSLFFDIHYNQQVLLCIYDNNILSFYIGEPKDPIIYENIKEIDSNYHNEILKIKITKYNKEKICNSLLKLQLN